MNERKRDKSNLDGIKRCYKLIAPCAVRCNAVFMNENDLGLLSNSSILLFDEAAQVYAQMLEGWARQQDARRLQTSTIKSRARVINSFQTKFGSYPWEWTTGDFELFISDLVGRKGGISHSSTRQYAGAIRAFCRYVSNPDYPWAAECVKRFGFSTAQIVNEWNSPIHKTGQEGRPERRRFSDHELQKLFDTADARVSRPMAGKKGQHVALRDSQMIKTAFAFGLRRGEVVGLDVVDLAANPHWPQLGSYAAIRVRRAKASNGGPPKRRTVLAIPEYASVSYGLRQWIELGRGSFDPLPDGPLWPSERHGRLSARSLEARFQSIREEAELPRELTLHCLRHTYISRLQEAGYSERFTMDQVGHTYASTTAIYTHIGDRYREAVLQAALGRMNDLDSDISTAVA